MQKRNNPVRLTILGVTALAIAGGLGWSRREIFFPPAKATAAKRPAKSARSKSKSAEQSVPDAKSPQVADMPVSATPSLPAGVAESKAKLTNKPPTAKLLEPKSAGFAGRLFLSLDVDRDGVLKPAEIPIRFRAAVLAHSKAKANEVNFAEFLDALPTLPDEDKGGLAVAAKAAPIRDVPVYRPQFGQAAKLPAWFKERDKNGDGQISLSEWPPGELAKFHQLDKNADGFITPDEAK